MIRLFKHRHKFKSIAGIYSDIGYVGDLFQCRCGERKTYIDNTSFKNYDCYIFDIKVGQIHYPEFMKIN